MNMLFDKIGDDFQPSLFNDTMLSLRAEHLTKRGGLTAIRSDSAWKKKSLRQKRKLKDQYNAAQALYGGTRKKKREFAWRKQRFEESGRLTGPLVDIYNRFFRHQGDDKKFPPIEHLFVRRLPKPFEKEAHGKLMKEKNYNKKKGVP